MALRRRTRPWPPGDAPQPSCPAQTSAAGSAAATCAVAPASRAPRRWPYTSAVQPPQREDLVVRHARVAHHRRAEHIEPQRQRAAFIAEQPSRATHHSPPPSHTANSTNGSRSSQRTCPGAAAHAALPTSTRSATHSAYSRFSGLRKWSAPSSTQRCADKRKPGQPIRQRAVALQVAARRKVALQRRGLFPHFAPAARVAVVLPAAWACGPRSTDTPPAGKAASKAAAPCPRPR